MDRDTIGTKQQSSDKVLVHMVPLVSHSCIEITTKNAAATGT